MAKFNKRLIKQLRKGQVTIDFRENKDLNKLKLVLNKAFPKDGRPVFSSSHFSFFECDNAYPSQWDSSCTYDVNMNLVTVDDFFEEDEYNHFLDAIKVRSKELAKPIAGEVFTFPYPCPIHPLPTRDSLSGASLIDDALNFSREVAKDVTTYKAKERMNNILNASEEVKRLRQEKEKIREALIECNTKLQEAEEYLNKL